MLLRNNIMFLRNIGHACPRLDRISQLCRGISSASNSPTGNHPNDTIYALASGEIKAGVSIIRVSGPEADTCLRELTQRTAVPKPRQISFRPLFHPQTKELLDQALVLRFPEPKSFTGENVVEFHVHGSRAVISGVLAALSDIQGCRAAEAGEFTERAFGNQKLDLVQVEGLADLLASETQAQRNQALRQMSGESGQELYQWQRTLISALAHAEALIDFGDDEADVSDNVMTRVETAVTTCRDEIRHHLADHGRSERLREGLDIVLLGQPNAGKSSLLNLLAQREAAIVSSVPGTTRDVIQVPMNLRGYPVTFHDTAGIRRLVPKDDSPNHDGIEEEGMQRALALARRADIRVIVVDGVEAMMLEEKAETWTAFRQQLEACAGEGQKTMVLFNKLDLMMMEGESQSQAQQRFLEFMRSNDTQVFSVSCKTQDGIESFIDEIKQHLHTFFESHSQGLITRARHREHLSHCAECLDNFLAISHETELAGEELRLAIQSLGRILGRVDVEDILDVLFRDFCIGK